MEWKEELEEEKGKEELLSEKELGDRKRACGMTRQAGAKPVSEPLTPSLIPLGCPLRMGPGGPGPAGFSRALPPLTRGRPGDASVGPPLEVRLRSGQGHLDL